MFTNLRAMFVLALLPALAGGAARGAAPTPGPAPAASQVAPAAASVRDTSGAAPGALAERFAQPEQTVEYHLMIEVPAISEADLPGAFQSRVVEPLKRVADVGALGKCRPAGYVDSRGRGLEKHHLIVRVRKGRVTIKARAAAPEALLALAVCTSRKYEIDQFEKPEYSISAEIDCGKDAVDIRSRALTAASVWAAVEADCPEVWRQLRPAIEDAGDLEIPGVAHMYDADATLRHPLGAKVKQAGVAVWFFPPGERFLVELSFTAYVKDREAMDRLYAELKAALAAGGLLRADQSSKTEQYFAAYDAAAAGRARPAPSRPR